MHGSGRTEKPASWEAERGAINYVLSQSLNPLLAEEKHLRQRIIDQLKRHSPSFGKEIDHWVEDACLKKIFESYAFQNRKHDLVALIEANLVVWHFGEEQIRLTSDVVDYVRDAIEDSAERAFRQQAPAVQRETGAHRLDSYLGYVMEPPGNDFLDRYAKHTDGTVEKCILFQPQQHVIAWCLFIARGAYVPDEVLLDELDASPSQDRTRRLRTLIYEIKRLLKPHNMTIVRHRPSYSYAWTRWE